MDCLAVYDSGNFTLKMCRHFEKMGYVFEVISLPCKIANQGCGYCLKFPIDKKDMVIDESINLNYPVREVFKIVKEQTRNKYEKLD